jgi:ADP-dependent NAD(P)H-hydrate dehydratase / NAD(P)H-hydrate epimerase
MESWLEPVLDAEQMRATDRWAIEDKGVGSLELMETAGRALAEAAAAVAQDGPARIVCGKGNNGGDGLVAARALSEMGFKVEAFMLAAADELSPDAHANFDRFPTARTMAGSGLAKALRGSGVVIDAVFGTGFEGEPREPATTAIKAINACGATVVAADIASGINASNGEVAGEAVRADLTVSFHAAKIGHWIAPGKGLTGDLQVVDIGIPAGAPGEPHAGLLRPEIVAEAPRRGSGSTKFSSGNVVVIGGSRGLTGAVCLASMAAIRAGAGYATAAVPLELESILEIKLTEVMTVGLPGREGHLRPAAEERALDACKKANAVVLGPGMGKNSGAATLARELAMRIAAPLVLDADGLGAHAKSVSPLAGREAATVLTPHTGELARLLGTDSEAVQARRLACAEGAAKQARGVVVLKGDDTIVTDGERVAINRISSPALATAGTGDVLSGMIAALVARGMAPFEAACAGVVSHSRAGLAAAKRVGPESVIAGDVIKSIPAGLARP